MPIGTLFGFSMCGTLIYKAKLHVCANFTEGIAL